MNRERKEIGRINLLLLALAMAMPAIGQVPVDENGNPLPPMVEGATPESFDDDELTTLSVGDLEDMVGPVALYPDDLLAIVLPASTYPLQIVQAARFLEQLETDPTLKPDEDWDESVTALLNYPEVLQLMNDDIDWTWRLGEAVVAQQADVIAAIEVFRDKAYAAGNLKSDEYQTVRNDEGVIEIEPAREDIIYVPYYEPEHVVIYQPRPVYYYYPRAYPVYYYPYPYGHSFSSGYFWGVTTAFSIGWMTDHLHVYHHSYWGHPYYGHHYSSRFYYRRPSITHFNHYYVHNSQRHWNYRYRDGDYWRPRRRGGARPGHDNRRVHYYRDRSRDDWRHQNSTSGATRTASFAGNLAGSDSQTRNRGRSGTGSRRQQNSATSSESGAIRFQPRDPRARADAERRRTRASEDLNSSAQRRTNFAASTRRPSSGSSSSRTEPRVATQAVNRAPNRRSNSRSSSRSGTSRGTQVAMNNPRRQVQPAPTRQARNSVAPRSPSRSQPSRSTPQRNAAPPRRSNERSRSSGRSENRSSESTSRGPSSRNESRSRRKH